MVKNNAKIGSRIAKEYSLLMHSHRSYSTHRPLIVGASVIDMTAIYKDENPTAFSSNPGKIKYSLGEIIILYLKINENRRCREKCS